jgi:hypothetical protein
MALCLLRDRTGVVGWVSFGSFFVLNCKERQADSVLVCHGEGKPALEYVNTNSKAGLKAGCQRVQLNAVVRTSS